jgi:hypothetical protein
MPRQDGEQQRLLRRLRADAQQIAAEIAGVKARSRVLLDLEAVRPLTADEAAQARALRRQGAFLLAQLRHLRAEVVRLQQAGRG